MASSAPTCFERCPECGEFNGATEARNLSWELPPDPLDDPAPEAWDWLRDKKSEIARTMDPGQVISVTCLCHGPLCRYCGVTRIHRPGSNSYEPESNTIGHWPGFSGMMPCAACREERDRA